MKINRILKKMCAIALAAALIGGSEVTVLPSLGGTDTGIAAKAAEYGDFEYSQESDNGPVTITGYNGTDTDVVIPSTISGCPVTAIGNYAFEDCSSITGMTISDSVNSIGDYTFSCCTNLKIINIPDSVTSIGEGAFYYCRGIKSITLPDSVKEIGERAFYNCSGLSSITIPDSMTSIDNGVFSHCINLNEITIPDSVTSIGSSSFLQCISLNSINIPDSVRSIGRGAFEECSRLSGIKIPYGIESIEYGTFYGCISLESITMPDSVKNIGGYAFYKCSSLKAVKIPDNVKSIGNCAFYYCSGLTSITIPNGVNKISEQAFYDCIGLTSIKIPDSVTGICKEAFYKCDNLKSIFIPDSVVSIDQYSFGYTNGCNKVDDFTIYGIRGSAAEAYAVNNGFNFIAAANPLENKTTLNKINCSVGERVTVTGAASGGTGPYTYEFYYKYSTASVWNKFGSNGTGNFIPDKTGTYTIMTCVKDGTGELSLKEYTLTVTKPLVNKTTVTKTNFSVGETITVKGAASGGTGPYTYEFYYKRSTVNSWTRFDKNGTGIFKPGSAGTFTIRTYVKDNAGEASVKEFTLTATEPLTNNTTVTKTNFSVGETITVKGAASGGTGPYTYEFYYKRSTVNNWTRFDKNGTGIFKPGSAGTFTIKTYVKDSTGKASVKEFTLTAK